MHTPDPHWLNIYRREKCEVAAFTSGLKAFFGIDTSRKGEFLDPLFLPLRKVVLDVFELEEEMEKRGYDDTISLKEYVEKEYGAEAVTFILRFLTPSKQ